MNKKGFTLVEIIVAVTLTAIIMAISVPGVMSYLESSSMDSVRVKGDAVVTATEALYNKKYALGDIGDFETNTNVKTSILEKTHLEDNGTNFNFSISEDQVSKLKIKIDGYYYKLENGVVTVTKNDTSFDTVASQESLAYLKEVFIDNSTFHRGLDSTAAVVSTSTVTKAIAEMKEVGFDLDEMGVKYWKFVTSGDFGFFYWCDIDISILAPGTTVPLLRYNFETETITCWTAKVKTYTTTFVGGITKTYQIVDGSWKSLPKNNNFTKSEQIYENIYPIYLEEKERLEKSQGVVFH